MRFKTDRKVFERALVIARKVASARNPWVPQGAVLLTAEKGKVQILATDLSAEIRQIIPASEIGEEGKTLLPASKLSALVRIATSRTLRNS